jgi:hypothetical protein
MSKKKIGTITLGEKTMLSDPCYGVEDTFCNVIIDTIAGEYNVYVTYTTSKWDDKCITSIIAIHKDYIKKYRTPNNEENLSCAVDSGTCGIFNAVYYDDYHYDDGIDDDWYDEMVCQDCPEFRITDEYGAFSSSGLGDGWYPVYAEYENNKAYAVRIKFL